MIKVTPEQIQEAYATWGYQKTLVNRLPDDYSSLIAYWRKSDPTKVSDLETKQKTGKIVSVALEAPCDWCELELRACFDDVGFAQWAYYYLWNNRTNTVYERTLFKMPTHKSKGLLSL